jgi:hypothetical protein
MQGVAGMTGLIRILMVAGLGVWAAAGAVRAELPAGPEDLSRWSVTDARSEVASDLLRAWPNNDDTSSFYVSPPLGDLRNVETLRFDLRSGGGTFYASALHDVIVQGPAGTARRDVVAAHAPGWSRHEIGLGRDDGGWMLDPGTASLDAVLAQVTALRIRAEYGEGEDWSELREVHLIWGAGAVALPDEVPLEKD